MRGLQLTGLAFVLISGLSCLPPAENPITEETATDPQGEQVDAATPEGTRCHSGTFECADGPIVAPCGTWYFDVTEDDAIVGYGEITSWLPNAPVAVTLSGVIDPTSQIIEITLTSAEDGSGTLNLSYIEPTLDLVGSWSFMNGPEPEGVEVSGGAAGVSCVGLPG